MQDLILGKSSYDLEVYDLILGTLVTLIGSFKEAVQNFNF